MSSTSDLQPIEFGSFPLAVFGGMFAGTVLGQFMGIGLDAALVGRHAFWVPLGCSVVLEAVAGDRLGARAHRRALTTAEKWRLSAIYSTGLGAVSIPLAVWTAAANQSAAPFGPVSPPVAVLLAVVVLAALAAVRFGLMMALGRRGSA